MKIDDKIRNNRIAYLLKGEASTAYELGLLYYILAKRRTAGDKIADACLKSIQWLKKAQIKIPINLERLESAEQLEFIEKILVDNKAVLFEKQASVGARHCQIAFDRPAIELAAGSFGLAYTR